MNIVFYGGYMSNKKIKNNKKSTKVKKAKSSKKKLGFSSGLRISLKTIVVLLLTISFVVGGILVGAAAGYVSTTTPITDEQLALDSLTTTIYDSKGSVIAQLKGSDNKNRIPVKLSQVPQDLQDAVVSIEDERFFDHQGIDLKRTAGAILNLFIPGTNKYGGSTITQQLVKNITGDDRTSIPRKIREQWRSLQLEQRLTKEQILETYLNVIYMGYDCYGVQAASKAYFNKDVSELSLAESAFLAGITNNPSKYNPLTVKGRENAKYRQGVILNKMLELGKITQAEHDAASKEELVINTDYKEESQARSRHSYFVDNAIIEVRRALVEEGYTETEATNLIYGGGISIYTTLDQTIQDAMDSVYTNVNNFPSNKNIDDPESYAQSAMVIMDPADGSIRALYGGYGEKSVNMGLNRATQMMRPAGSSIKPIVVYGPLMDAGKITAASVVDDAPVYMNNKKPNERYPTNYSSNSYPGLITVRTAVATSSNIVAAKLFSKNMDLSLEYLANLGIDRREERYVSVALGGLNQGVNPLDMAAAFVPFANKGFYYEPHSFTRVLDRTGKVLVENEIDSRLVYQDKDTPSIMTNVMQSVVTSGTARGKINIKGKDGKAIPAAGKTGTSDYDRDNWFVGYTPYLVGATWYGFDMNEVVPRGERSQSTVIWNKVMAEVHKNYESKGFTMSPTVVKKEVCKYSGKLATELCKKDPRGSSVITEYFSAKNVPTQQCDVHVEVTLCKETNAIATNACPSTHTKVYIKRPEPYTPKLSNEPRPKDIAYDLPKNLATCTKHPAVANKPSPVTPTPTPSPTPKPSPTPEDTIEQTEEPTDAGDTPVVEDPDSENPDGVDPNDGLPYD